MQIVKRIVFALMALLFLVPISAYALPSSVDRIIDHIEPLLKGDYIKGLYFTATSTSQASTFPYASTTVTSATGFCLSTDCINSWAAAGAGNKTWEINANGALAPTTTLGIQVSASSTIGSGSAAGGLTVAGTATTTGLKVSGTGNFANNIFVNATAQGLFFGAFNTFTHGIFRDALGAIVTQTNSLPRFYVANNGNVGVGTSSPYALSSIHANANNATAPKDLLVVASSTSVATTTHLVVKNTGRVGIGTTSPEELLHLWASTGYVTQRVDSGNGTQGQFFANDAANEVVIGSKTASVFKLMYGNAIRAQLYEPTSAGTIFQVDAPSGNPQEATFTTKRDFGSGNFQGTDWTNEDFGVDAFTSINSFASGTLPVLPILLRGWVQSCGQIHACGLPIALFDPVKGTSQIGRFTATSTATTTALAVGASSTVPHLISAFNSATVNDASRVWTITSSGREGLGTSTPSKNLHIVGSFPGQWITNTDTTQFAGSQFCMNNAIGTMGNQGSTVMYSGINDVGNTQGFFALDQGNVNCGAVNHILTSDFNTQELSLYTNGLARLTASSTGNITLGGGSQATGLIVNGGATTTGFLTVQGATSTFANSIVMNNGQYIAATGTTAAPSYSFLGDRGTGFYNSSTNVVSFVTAGNIRFAYGNTSVFSLNVPILSGVTGSQTAPSFASFNNNGTGMFFPNSDSALAFTASGRERMRFMANGYTGIGTTSPFALVSIHASSTATSTTLFAIASSTSAATSTHLMVNNTGAIFTPNLTTSVTGNAVCITTAGELTNAGASACVPSSEKYKDIKGDMPSGEALNTIMQLQPKVFTYKAGVGDTQEHLGLIAEDVQKVDDRLVVFNANGEPETLHFEEFTALFVQAIQEMRGGVYAARRTAEEDWQWVAIGLLVIWNLGITFRRRK